LAFEDEGLGVVEESVEDGGEEVWTQGRFLKSGDSVAIEASHFAFYASYA
jgi:hypothetical protein